MANHAETTITLTDDASAVITNGLRAYNEAQAGCWDGRPLAIFVRDLETKKVAGGLLGRTSLGLLILISGSPNTNDLGANHLLHHTLGTLNFRCQLEIARTVRC